MSLFLTNTQSHISRTLPVPCTARQSSPSSTSSELTTTSPSTSSDIFKTAVITPFGLFEFLQMPFRLRNAAQTFQRFIDEILRGLHFSYAYIDDLLIASSSPEKHSQHLRLIFQITTCTNTHSSLISSVLSNHLLLSSVLLLLRVVT